MRWRDRHRWGGGGGGQYRALCRALPRRINSREFQSVDGVARYAICWARAEGIGAAISVLPKTVMQLVMVMQALDHRRGCHRSHGSSPTFQRVGGGSSSLVAICLRCCCRPRHVSLSSAAVPHVCTHAVAAVAQCADRIKALPLLLPPFGPASLSLLPPAKQIRPVRCSSSIYCGCSSLSRSSSSLHFLLLRPAFGFLNLGRKPPSKLLQNHIG